MEKEELLKVARENIHGLFEGTKDKEIQDFYVRVVANLIHQTVESELTAMTEKYNKLKEAFEELTQDAINLKYQVEAKDNQVKLISEANEKLKHSFESLLHAHIVFKLEKKLLAFGKNGSMESLKEPYLVKAGLKEQ